MSKYPCKVRKGLLPPWGYEVHPDDNSLFTPIEEQLDAYEEAKKFIKQGCSYRDTATWLSQTTGNSITGAGLFLKIKRENRDKRSAAAKKAYLKQIGAKEDSAAETQEED